MAAKKKQDKPLEYRAQINVGGVDWRNDLWPAHFDFHGSAVIPIPGQVIKGDNE